MAELSDAAELASEAVEEVVNVARNHIAWMWGGLLSGLAIGLGGGFLGTRRFLETKYEKIAEDEIEDMRDHFRQRLDARRAMDKKPDLKDLNEKAEELGYKDPPAPGEPNVHVDTDMAKESPSEIRTVFESDTNSSEDWDYEVEKEGRAQGGIYVIHKDEYGETDNNEATLSYYGGDDILCDSNDHIIEVPERLVGDCLDKFGHGSNDRNVVYVRNETLDVDLEVIKSEKTYAEEVHGFKHEDPPRRRIQKYEE